MVKSITSLSLILSSESVNKLTREYGLSRLWVPSIMMKSHPLSILLGHDEALLLAECFGGGLLYIANNTELLRANRNIEIVKAFSEGASVKVLSREYRLSERRIYTIVSKPN